MNKTFPEAMNVFRAWQTPRASIVEAERVLHATEMRDESPDQPLPAIPIQTMAIVYGRRLNAKDRGRLRDSIKKYYRNIVNKD